MVACERTFITKPSDVFFVVKVTSYCNMKVSLTVFEKVSVCVCVCVRACVRAHACACMHACMHALGLVCAWICVYMLCWYTVMYLYNVGYFRYAHI